MGNKCFICGNTQDLKRVKDDIDIYICEECSALVDDIRGIRKSTIVLGGGSIEIDFSDGD